MRTGIDRVVQRICAVFGTESDYANLWRRGDRSKLLDAVAIDHASIEQRVQVIKLYRRPAHVVLTTLVNGCTFARKSVML